ncbi:hypothetical protein MUP01_03690, partial [Candidatus Bathyarchaeota archaeon]|nr:hypothetical protein [Candidatus Bathyarchaeota archaeon]
MSAISTASSLYNILAKLKSVLDKHKQKKDVGNKLVNVLGDDIDDYLTIFEEIGVISQKSLVPLIESIGDIASKSQIDKLVAYT